MPFLPARTPVIVIYELQRCYSCGAVFHNPYTVHEELPLFTRQQLSLRNGQDREEIWCAYQGIIYDVTASRLWRNGKHYEHWAGQDLTEELAQAPHEADVFQRFKAVGRLS
jgi:predicted heme/steroid binding protein